MSKPNGGAAKLWLVVVMIVALAGATGARYAQNEVRGGPAGASASAARLDRLDSFTLSLVLGGMRGPLAMFLWMSSEEQKDLKELEDFDTRVELIRMLQAEFDSVHIFQVWNKAYNISAQKASLANKYYTIVDAVRYARSVEDERPNNLNMIYAAGDLYFEKLGRSQEKFYFRERVRQQTKHRPDDDGNRLDTVLRQSHRSLLTPDHNIDPDRVGVDSGLIKPELWHLANDETLGPFPHGVSTFALAYDYFKRAQELSRDPWNQRHRQLSLSVIDSRPALAMRGWVEDLYQRARRLELGVVGREPPDDVSALATASADLPLDGSIDVDPEVAAEINYSYAKAASLVPRAIVEYDDHLERFPARTFTYNSHVEFLELVREVAMADQAYWELVAGLNRDTPEARQTAIRTAIELYERAKLANQRFTLMQRVDAADAQILYPLAPDGTQYNARTIRTAPPEVIRDTYARVEALTEDVGFASQTTSEFIEQHRITERADIRMSLLRSAMDQTAAAE